MDAMSNRTNPYRMAHSFSREDPTAGRNGLTPGTTRRVLEFAKPYSRHIAVFLVLLVTGGWMITRIGEFTQESYAIAIKLVQ